MKLKTILDYYKQIFEKYPTIDKQDIKRILLYGWKSWFLHNSRGGDVLVSLGKLWFYSGSLTKDSIRWFHYYRNKMKIKLRVMYKDKKIKWNGYYYFALTRTQYETYLAQKAKRVGRPRKNFTFEKVFFYKIYDECNLSEFDRIAIFRIPYSWNRGYKFYEAKLVTSEAELVTVREPLKFKDILLSADNYEFIDDDYNHKNRRHGK